MKKKIFDQVINCEVTRLGRDFAICVYGGDEPHLGALCLAVPYYKNEKLHASVSTLVIPTHRDNVIAELFAKRFALAFNSNVSCSCGIHYDIITSSEIEKFILLMELFAEEVIEKERAYE
ncbi:hypothetical protein [Dielma fastidiosa]|uniref:Prenylated flavin chaperone LpdD-like domain-containing protein n=1 Tax=Dielma fastidiosa TaxID=1034346 RepID=A0A318KQV6_9FIRM|nr:hypothetical protein [Dielma fastidiosa]PXX80129.1 hypothetical protein DES51_104134 [Dielma fastidiosa]